MNTLVKESKSAITSSSYQAAVSKNFSFLKQTTRLDDLYAKCVTLIGGSGYLIPVCELHTTDDALINSLCRWRAENSFAFPSQFPVTMAGTASWLKNKLLDVEDRILFLIIDKHGYPVGHLGYANSMNDECLMEIDNVVRGEKNVEAGIMANAMRTVINWAEEVIGPRGIFLRVFNDNEHAVGFYRKLGFKDNKLLSLRKRLDGVGVYYEPVVEGDSKEPDKYFLRMVYEPNVPRRPSGMILTAGPSISGREKSYVLDAVGAGWNVHWNDYIKKFESAFADYLGVKYALSTSSCTGALHLALAALSIGPGDEVIVPDITWVATANAVVYAGATPIFVDVDLRTWCLDVESFEASITERTKAVIPVHLYGHPAEMNKIMEIARKRGLYVIEDAAPAIGAECRNQKVGTFGDFAAFSFQGAKLVVTGEGGMLVCNNEELFRRAYAIWDQGRTPGTFWINEIGWKYKMSNIQAALGLAQLERVDELIESKRRIFSWYADQLGDLASVSLNFEMEWALSIYWMTSLLLSKDVRVSRDELQEELKKLNIDTRPIFPAISQYNIWPKRQNPNPRALRISHAALNLPTGVCLKRWEVEYICQQIRKIIC